MKIGSWEDGKRGNGACGTGLATALMQSAKRLWFTSVNGYGSYERE